jgi:aspartate aminotransferase-like enzyme
MRLLRLYKHLGFVPFGPVVGSDDAQFQPMYLTLETFLQMAKLLSPPSAEVNRILASYLPGPVDVHEEVRKAFERAPVSHRSDIFSADFKMMRRLLCELTGAQSVEVMLGSGSLANDAIGGQISLLGKPGLVLSNGEFGNRLIDHAARLGLDFDAMQFPWGEAFDFNALNEHLEAHRETGWIWAVHCETSTGITNDIGALRAMATARGAKLCLDCISSIGTIPVNLSGVYLASCVSGKGLAAFPGLSMVFYNHELTSSDSLPRYLDLGYYAAQEGIPFTHSSNLVYALLTALQRTSWKDKFAQIADVSKWLRDRVRELGFQIVAAETLGSPAVVTIVLPPELSSRHVGWLLQQEGYLLSYKSEYLLKRNWIQICLMGEWSRENLMTLPNVLSDLCAQSRQTKHLQPASA